MRIPSFTHKGLAIIKYHWMAVLVGLIATTHVMLPTVIGRIVAGTAYQGVYYSDNGDWSYYVARIRDLSEGHGGGNPYLAEHAEDPYLNIPGSEKVLSLIVRGLRIDPINLQIALDIVAPFIITLIFYALLFKLSKNRWIAASIPFLLIILNVWNMDKPIHPQMNLPLLLLFLLCWFSLLFQLDEHPEPSSAPTPSLRIWPKILLCGILLGVLYFVYFYDWSFLYVVLGCSAVLSILTRKFKAGLLNLFIIGISAPFGVYFASFVLRAIRSPLYEEVMIRNSSYHSHLPQSLPRLLIATVACLLFYILLRYANIVRNHTARGIFALLLANVIYPNHQIITGLVPQTAEHWSFMPILIFALATAFIYPYLKHLLTGNSILMKASATAFLAIFLMMSLRLSTFHLPAVTSGKLQAFSSAQRYGPIFKYLNQATPPNSVILTDNQQLSYLIPAFTHNYIYYARYGIFAFPSSDRELMERYLLSSQLDPYFIKNENFGLTTSRRVLWGAIFPIEQTLLFRLLRLQHDDRYTFEKELLYAQETFQNLKSVDGQITFDALKKYRLDYVIWDNMLHPEWAINRFPQLEKIFEKQNLTVFRVHFTSSNHL